MTERQEEWREVPDFPDYEVSNLGRVRSWRNPKKNRRAKPKMLKSTINKVSGYPYVDLSNGEARRNCTVHRLVLLAFVSAPPLGMEVCHNDGNPANANLSNLRWDTPTSNQADRAKHGTSNKGDRNGMSAASRARRASV